MAGINAWDAILLEQTCAGEAVHAAKAVTGDAVCTAGTEHTHKEKKWATLEAERPSLPFSLVYMELSY